MNALRYSVPTENLKNCAGNDSGGGQLGNAVRTAVPTAPTVYRSTSWSRKRDLGRSRQASGPKSTSPLVCNRSSLSLKIGDRHKPARRRLLDPVRREIHQARNDGDPQRARCSLRPDHVDRRSLRRRSRQGTRHVCRARSPQRKWFNVGMPIKLSASPAKIERSPHSANTLKRS